MILAAGRRSAGERPKGVIDVSRRLGLIAGITIMSVAITQPGFAAKQKLKLSGARTEKYCSAGAQSTCAGKAVALKTGAISVDAAMISPLNGLAPGQGFNGDSASVNATYVLRKAVRSLPFLASIRVDAASATHSGVLFTAQPQSSATGFAGANAHMSVSKVSCTRFPNGGPTFCSGNEIQFDRELANATGPTTAGRRTLTFRGALLPFSFDGPPGARFGSRTATLSPGRVDFRIWLTAASKLGGCGYAYCQPDPVMCTWDAGCVLELAFPGGCVDQSCAIRIPHCIDAGCETSIPPYGCLDPDCAVYYPYQGCVDPDCNLYFPPWFQCIDPDCNVFYPFTLWCLSDFQCATDEPLPDGVRQELADTGIARATARGVVTGIWVG